MTTARPLGVIARGRAPGMDATTVEIHGMAESAHAGDDARGLGALIKDLAEGSGELIRHAVRLARLAAT